MSGRHYRALSMMHQQVQEEIDDAGRCPQPDRARISRLKRLRLSIKGRIQNILEAGREATTRVSIGRNPRRQTRSTSLTSAA